MAGVAMNYLPPVDKMAENQPRKPKGDPEGGQWTSGGGGGAAIDTQSAATGASGWSVATIYHGSGADLERFSDRTPVYLTSSVGEAKEFSQGRHLGGAGGDAKVYSINFKPGRTKNIDPALNRVLDEGGDLDDEINRQIKIARGSGKTTRYLSFTHPGLTRGGDFKATISLYPKSDLRIVSSERVLKGVNPLLPLGKMVENQPRKPKGDPEGGQWTDGGGGGALRDKYGLTEDEQDMMWGWTGGADHHTLKDSDKFTRVLEKLPQHKGEVFRGMVVTKSKLTQFKKGVIFSSNYHASSSSRKAVANKFAESYSEDHTSVLLQIKQKSGRKIPSSYYPHEVLGPSEHEIVLPRKTRYRVTKVVKSRVGMVVSLVEV